MVIEHSFVTTLPPERAMGLASDLLARGGFVAERDAAFDVSGGGGWTTLQVRRGRQSAARAKDPTQVPQQVRLEWDRGRVTVAAAIEPPSNRGRSFGGGGVLGMTVLGMTVAGGSGKRAKRFAKPYADLMVAISEDVDDLLAGRVTAEAAGGRWFAMDHALREKARLARRRSYIYLGIFLAIVIGLIVLIVLAAENRW